MIRRHTIPAAALWLALSTGTVLASEPARDLSLMSVANGAVIYVRTADGAEIRSRFIRASPQSLTISGTDGREMTVPVAQVALVWKEGDSLRNGAIVGALIGLAGGILGQSQCTDCSSEIAIGIAVGVPIWAGLGALVDRQHVGRTLIYRSP